MNNMYKKIILETINLLKENEEAYSKEELEKARIALGLLIDTTLTKPTLDVNTFVDPNNEMTRDNYEWFRDNPSEYIEAYSDSEDGDIDTASASYGPKRDPKQTTLLYYLYRGVYYSDGKWNIGKGENIEDVIREIRARASAFVDAISDRQILIDVFFSDWKNIKDNTNAYIQQESTPTIVSSFMSKGSPGEFKSLVFGKFRRGAMYGATTTKGIMGTRDHMYKGSKEFDNISDEHKPFFLFEYIWQTCYNYAQADGLRPSSKNVETLSPESFATNYQTGLTKKEQNNLFGKGWIPELMKKAPSFEKNIGFIIDPLSNALLNKDRKVANFSKPVSEMNSSEVVQQLSSPFERVLDLSKESLKLNLYPSGIIDLLRIKELIPLELINSKSRKFSRTIKGLKLAGYLDEKSQFTDMVKNKDYKPQPFIYDNLRDFESVVKSISNEIKKGRVSEFSLNKMREKYDLLSGDEKNKALEILTKYKVSQSKIVDATIDTENKNVQEVESLLFSMMIKQEEGKPFVDEQAKLSNLISKSTEAELKEIRKLINYYKSRGVV